MHVFDCRVITLDWKIKWNSIPSDRLFPHTFLSVPFRSYNLIHSLLTECLSPSLQHSIRTKPSLSTEQCNHRISLETLLCPLSQCLRHHKLLHLHENHPHHIKNHPSIYPPTSLYRIQSACMDSNSSIPAVSVRTMWREQPSTTTWTY